MSLISKEHLSLTLQSIKKLLSYKADKDEIESVQLSVGLKADRRELEEEIARVYDNIAQSDWNQDDESAMDYIKNRPFYEQEKKVSIFEEQIVNGFSVIENSIYGIEGAISINSIPENECTVNWDGTLYNGVFQTDNDTGMIYFGNKNYLTMTPGGNIPFCIIILPDFTNNFIKTESASTSHRVSISTTEIELKQLDSKYFPELNYVQIPENKFIASGITAFSAQTSADLSMPYSKTPRLEVGKIYCIYVDGILSYTAECVNNLGRNSLYYPGYNGSGGYDPCIYETLNGDKYVIRAWVNKGLPWNKSGLTIDIYEKDSFSKEYLPPDTIYKDWAESELDLKVDKTEMESALDDIYSEISAAKDYVLLNDVNTGIAYKIEVRDGNLVSSLHASLDDFTYATNDDGTFTITGWNETYAGKPSTIMIVPNDSNIII